MWQFLCGVGTGIYIGTMYNCKPMITTIKTFINDNMPKENIQNEENSKHK